MRHRHLLSISVILIATGCGKASSVQPPALDPDDVVSITWHQEEPCAEQQVTIEDSDTIKALVALLTLRGKPRCACAHCESMIFRARNGIVAASICDHCFDIIEGDARSSWEMPPEFRDKLGEAVRKAQAEGGR